MSGFRTKYDLALQEKWYPSCLHPRRMQYREGFEEPRPLENYTESALPPIHPISINDVGLADSPLVWPPGCHEQLPWPGAGLKCKDMESFCGSGICTTDNPGGFYGNSIIPKCQKWDTTCDTQETCLTPGRCHGLAFCTPTASGESGLLNCAGHPPLNKSCGQMCTGSGPDTVCQSWDTSNSFCSLNSKNCALCGNKNSNSWWWPGQ